MGPSLKNFWLAIVAAATAARDVATTAAFLVRAYEDEDLRGPEERCESHRRLLLSAVYAFLLNIVSLRGAWSMTMIAGRVSKYYECIYYK
jgi:hypothetical protein